MSKLRKVDVTEEQKKKILDIIDGYKDTQGALIQVLHDVQDYFGYLPIEVQEIISDAMNVPLAEIYGIVLSSLKVKPGTSGYSKYNSKYSKYAKSK